MKDDPMPTPGPLRIESLTTSTPWPSGWPACRGPPSAAKSVCWPAYPSWTVAPA